MSSDDQSAAAAMMSVYYHSMGQQLELRGAPAVMLPPPVRPMPLEAAIEQLEDVEPRAQREALQRQALWTLLRSAPPAARPGRTGARRAPPLSLPGIDSLARRYVPARDRLANAVGFDDEAYAERRGQYRERSNLLAAALAARARQPDDFKRAFDAVWPRDRVRRSTAEPHALTPEAYLAGLAPKDDDWPACLAKLEALERDTGMNLQTFAGNVADTAAFMHAARTPQSPLVVYPTAIAVVQDSRTLTTTVTATSVACADDERRIKSVLDPLSWCKWSDSFESDGVKYVAEDGSDVQVSGPLQSRAEPCYIRENVNVRSGLTPTVIATFDNVLRVKHTPAPDGADLHYWLHRSVRSRYLWDDRPGGILVDQGFAQVRRIGPASPTSRVWRVTVRKVLRFADRTPTSWDDTPLQFGQSLNYLAPAALTWWVQSGIFNAAHD